MPDSPAPAGADAAPEARVAEESAFYHEAALNAAWTGSRLAIGALTFLFGAFAFAYFYLESSGPQGMWYPKGFHGPYAWEGAVIMALVVGSAAIQTVVLQRLKAGAKSVWQWGALAVLGCGIASVGLQIWELLSLPFQPGSCGFASVFTGFYPVALVSWLAAMIWLEILIVRAAKIPAISFVEQPPTYAEAFDIQRFQASLSSFTAVWNFLAVITFAFWLMFYVR
jgi:heme/copper-type cytochrome/quinol oxidase subunit 3